MSTKTNAVIGAVLYIGISMADMVHHRQLAPETHEHHPFRFAGAPVVTIATVSATARVFATS